MLVTPLTANETINWFEQQDRQHEILCFMVTADPRHRGILRELAQNYIDSDIALGSKVAFILFGDDNVNRYPEVDFSHGTRMFLPGAALQPGALHSYVEGSYFGRGESSRETQSRHFGLESYQVDLLATETAKVSAEWMKALGLKRSALPALCVFVKGSDPAIISLGDALDASKVLKLFGRLADIAERDCEKALGVTFDAEARMSRALRLGKEIELLERSFEQHMEAMCNRFKATPEERALIADFLSRKAYSDEALDKALVSCRFSTADGFTSNTTVKGARNKLRKLTKAVSEMDECRPREGMVESLSEAVRRINGRRRETARLVAELLVEGVEAKSVDRQALGVTYDKYAARANQTVTLLEKVGKFVGLVGGAGLIAQILK